MLQFLNRTIDARPLAAGRIVVGLAALPIAFEWAIPLLKVASGAYLGMPVFSAWGTVPATAVLVLLAVAVAAALAMVAGMAGRLPALLVAACSAVALSSDQQAYSNHLVLLLMLSTFIGLSGAANAYSVSAGVRKTEVVPYWPAFLIKIQVTTLYAWSVAAEAFVAVALWVPRSRLAAFAVGAGLHLGIIALLSSPAPLIPFAALMFSSYILFAHDSVQTGRWSRPTWSPPARGRSASDALR